MKTEYFIYNLNGTDLFIYRKGNSEYGIWKESKEYFSGLDCHIGKGRVSFYNGQITLPIDELKMISQDEFIEYGKDHLEDMEQYGLSIKTRLQEYLKTRYHELRRLDSNSSYKVNDSKKAYYKKSHKRRTGNGNN